jgi:hypothetical protein
MSGIVVVQLRAFRQAPLPQMNADKPDKKLNNQEAGMQRLGHELH